MKKINLFLVVLLICQLGNAQTTTTIQVTEENGTFEQQGIFPIKDCFLCTQGDVNRLFKFGYSNLSAIHQPLTDYAGSMTYLPSFLVGYEQKIATGFSINSQLEWSHLRRKEELLEDIKVEAPSLYQYNSSSFKNFSLSIEPRWYFQKKQQIKAGQSGNNLNGTYIGLQLSNHWWTNGTYTTHQEGPTNSQSYDHKGSNQVALINLGWQQDFFDRSFVNFRLGTGISHNTQVLSSLSSSNGETVAIPTLSKWKWALNYQVTWGGIIGKKNKEETPTDNFIEYYEEAKDMWKVDLFNLFQGLNEKGAIGRLHIAYEYKLSKSQFSLESGLQYLYSFNSETNQFDDQFVFQFEPRFYYRLRKDTRKGLAANNLSSMYLGLVNQWNISGASLSRRKNNYNYDVTWGAQFRFVGQLYGDVRMGLGLQDMINDVSDYPLFYDFRLGFAF